jgi:hypothetical protein
LKKRGEMEESGDGGKKERSASNEGREMKRTGNGKESDGG